MMNKLGSKAMKRYAIGVKHGVHMGSKFGSKASGVALSLAPVASLALGPEAGLALETAGMVGRTTSNILEKASR